jgi:hypothetical protein
MYPDRWLKAAMLKGKERTVTVKELKNEAQLKPDGKTEQVWILSFEKTDKELGLNKTNARLLFALLGETTEDWIGKRVTLAPETDKSGMSDDGLCIRVVGSPDIKAPIEVAVKGAMGKRLKRTLRPTEHHE